MQRSVLGHVLCLNTITVTTQPHGGEPVQAVSHPLIIYTQVLFCPVQAVSHPLILYAQVLLGPVQAVSHPFIPYYCLMVLNHHCLGNMQL